MKHFYLKLMEKRDTFKKIISLSFFVKEDKIFMVRFTVKDGKMATEMTTKNMSPQESIGLLEIAKQQILDGVKQNKKEIFRGSKDA